LGIVFPKETVKKIDERKGRYYSRNKYLLKIVEEHLNDNELKNVQGSRLETPTSQAQGTTTTILDKTTPAAESLTNMTTNRGRRIGDVDANDR
jgi:hypothetical protein